MRSSSTGSMGNRGKMRGSVAAAGMLALTALAGVPAQGPSEAPPVERRAEQMFEVLRKGRDAELRAFLEAGLHDSFFDMGPLELHLEQFGKIRDALGDFDVREIRLAGPHRGDFLLQAAAGGVYRLHLETEPIEPYRLAGIGFEPYDSRQDVPRFESLDHVDRHLKSLEGAGLFSGVVLVARDGEPDWVRAYGMADKDRRIPNVPGTRFDVGSITKGFTALAVMQLVENGKIDLEAPMSRYLEGFPPEIGDRVRVIDLLRMESGYGDYLTSGLDRRRDRLRSVSDYVEWIRSMPLEFEPGTNRRYSNTGYVLLGAIVEAASGTSYYDYVRKHVFEPAGMADSFFPAKADRPERTAIGYTNHGPSGRDGYVDTNLATGDLRGTPAGGSYSTAADLLRYNRALRADRLLDEGNTTLLLNFFEEGEMRPAVRGIAGGAPGVSAVLEEDADNGLVVIVLSNHDEPVAEEVGGAVFRMLRGPVATRSEGPAGSAPMSVVQDQPSVDVRVAGQGPFRFLIDTGAAGAGRISAELVERLGLKEAGEVLVGDPSGRNAATRSLVRVPELTFAGRSWKDLDMLVAGDDAEIPGIAGILGFAMFGDVLLTLDYPGKQVRLQSGALPPADGREVLEFVSEHGIPAIEIDLAGTKVLADLDSGSMGWVMVPGQMAESMPLAETPRVVGRASTAFNEFEIRSARLNGRLRVGGHEIENPPVEFADLFPRGNVGGQFLGQFAVSFDQENRRVRFTRSGEEPLVRKPRYRIGAMIGMGPDGWKIEGVVAGSPAERAGLRTGDRIARVNGTPVEELAGEASARMLGSPDEVVLDVLRGEETLELRLTPEPM